MILSQPVTKMAGFKMYELEIKNLKIFIQRVTINLSLNFIHLHLKLCTPQEDRKIIYSDNLENLTEINLKIL